ncbi:hydroxymethylglutaryl-CoA lyase [Pedobacter sp. SL55]|uniref:hydroxymethylglutaryl-CoA lyase n=1 Tax=Pedobacter sp. SL55 TaxID=2995161 RepID=UPI00226F1F92|nr:hydroxymethylglutaryl-CoA lyase [Pedobacter sp. SL55]WAC39362.1 hydroxymethylglutaryl-CoA lyase [Pedobacter sp. SL55]
MMPIKTENFNNPIKLVECPRDAMQGLHDFVPTDLKIEYLNLLLKVGFDTLDFGSFVSPKAIPQMRDTEEVLAGLDLSGTTKLLAIVANLKGVENAVKHPEITYLGFPFSISETFQQRNTNASIAQSLHTVEEILNLCEKHNKQVVVYLSMGFGNPYGDEWNTAIVSHWANELVKKGVKIISVADTVGVSTPDKIMEIFPPLVQAFPDIEFGLHLHSTPQQRLEKIEAALAAGCTRMDSALKGFGGCPMAADDLTGNISTENVISYLNSKGVQLNLDMEKWNEAMMFSGRVFH